MTPTGELTLADEVAVVIVRLVCDVDRPLTWRADPHTAVAATMFLEQTIVKTCSRMQQLGLSPRDVLRHDGGCATACIVDTVRADIGTFSNSPVNAAWQTVIDAAITLVDDVRAEQKSRKRFDMYSAT